MNNGLRRYGIPVVVLVVLLGTIWAVVPATHAAVQLPGSTLVSIQAVAHPEAIPRYERVIFQFSGPVPLMDVRYVTHLVADASGLPVPITGQAILQLTLRPAQAHTAQGRHTAPARIKYRFRNVQEIVSSDDFEGVLTYGIGLAHQAEFRVTTLDQPSRVVVDVLNP